MKKPFSADKLFRKAVGRHQLGDLAGASEAFQQLLKIVPRHAPSLHMLGIIAMQLDREEVAIDLIKTAIAVDPAQISYRNNLGEALRRCGRPGEAAEQFQVALGLDPAHPGAHVNMALLYHAHGDLNRAIIMYRRAIDLAPHLATAHMNLGVALADKGELGHALASLQHAKSLAPRDSAITLNLANVLLACDETASSEAICRAGLADHPENPALEVALARALRAQGKVAEALEHDERAVSLAPDLPQAHWNRGVDQLLLGNYQAGWADFRWRWRAGVVPPHNLPTPEWQGEPIVGKHLLVHAEQGLGDTLQFIRFVTPLAQHAGAKITLLVQKPLQRLLEHAALPVDAIITPEQSLPQHDLHVPLLDLPGRLDITLDGLTPTSPYIPVADPAPRQADKTRIGLVWKGRRDHANDRNRSIDLVTLTPLLGLPLSWVSLQQGVTPAEQEILARQGVEDRGGDFADLAETARAIAGLDLVISVDTSIAHLAGATGQPVWILLPFAPDWRWMTERSDSPWYPTARLFRQTVARDWSSVVEALVEALESLEKRPSI